MTDLHSLNINDEWCQDLANANRGKAIERKARMAQRLVDAKAKFARTGVCYHPLEFTNYILGCEVCGASAEDVEFDAEPLEFDDEAEMS